MTDSVRDCVAPSLESWSLVLDLQVLHSVLLLAHGDRLWRGLLRRAMAQCLIVAALRCRAALAKRILQHNFRMKSWRRDSLVEVLTTFSMQLAGTES